jgi:hypothetical protein
MQALPRFRAASLIRQMDMIERKHESIYALAIKRSYSPQISGKHYE